MTSTPSPGVPNSPMQSEKSKRYDRQLRLWGDHGQVWEIRRSVISSLQKRVFNEDTSKTREILFYITRLWKKINEDLSDGLSSFRIRINLIPTKIGVFLAQNWRKLQVKKRWNFIFDDVSTGFSSSKLRGQILHPNPDQAHQRTRIRIRNSWWRCTAHIWFGINKAGKTIRHPILSSWKCLESFGKSKYRSDLYR